MSKHMYKAIIYLYILILCTTIMIHCLHLLNGNTADCYVGMSLLILNVFGTIKLTQYVYDY